MVDDSPAPISLAERARNDVARLVAGNGLSDTDVILLDQNEATYQIAATLDVTLAIDTKIVSGKGRPKVQLTHMFEHMTQLEAALPLMRDEFLKNPGAHNILIQKLTQRPDQGWGMDDGMLTFPELDETVGAVESCAACQGQRHIICQTCHGQAQQDCQTCAGRRDVQCVQCAGTGRDGNGNACNICHGLRRMACPACQGKGVIHCQACNGRGQQPCKSCDATGSTYQLATLNIICRCHFQLQPNETTPAELQRALSRIPMKSLAGGRASIAIGDTTVTNNILRITYNATLPFARPRLRIGVQDASLSILGYKPMIAEAPPFLDALLQPAMNLIRAVRTEQLDGTRALADLSQLRIVREALTQFNSVKKLRARYPFGLSPQLATELIKSLSYIAARITVRPRQLAAAAAVCLSVVIFLIYFMFSGRGNQSFTIFDIFMLLTMVGFTICTVLVAHMFALEYAMKRFSKEFKTKINNIGGALGKIGAIAVASTVAGFMLVYLLSR